MLLFSPLLIFLNSTVLMLTLCYFFLLTIKVVQDASSLIISFPFLSPQNPAEERTRAPQIIHAVSRTSATFASWGEKLIVGFGFPKYQWGPLVHSVSQVFASICLKGVACVTCQLLRKVQREYVLYFTFVST